ncbi:methylated-DNA-protein-cysteine methyltransferase related protein [Saccharicrinis carchari]|uniref:Methylated-DNA-protein-cysteine methyltransferase related protein n=1 Tax=Saccharicrinis carchari TaxID=1168039 RepID=A0A521EUD2_SACCC|nr:MGMT family protein [Saccharicrinis carchari]SMO87031.1 methylated-DNA-protein-cysteine methyltransferase related protein [Saccharicrinis carchari]
MVEGDFFKQVHQVVQLIPYGRVTSYGAIASYLGSAGAARMVGWALHKSGASAKPIPAHRVLNRNGLLSGKAAFPGENIMQQLLESEGLTVVNNQVKDFEKYFWDPKELDDL